MLAQAKLPGRHSTITSPGWQGAGGVRRTVFLAFDFQRFSASGIRSAKLTAGEILRDLTLDPTHRYQPQKRQQGEP